MSEIMSIQPAKVGFPLGLVIVVFLAGCGLALNNEQRLDRAESAIEEGDYRAGIIDAKNVLEREPNNVRGRLILARASIEIGDGATAEKEFVRALDLGTPVEDVIVGLIQALVQQGKFSELIDMEPIGFAQSEGDIIEVQQLLGQAYLGTNRPESAREHFELVLQMDSQRVDAKLGIATSFESEKNFVQTRSVLDEIVTSHPDDVRGWISYGRLNLRLRTYERAESNFNVAVRLAEEQVENSALFAALVGLVDTFLAQRRTDEAREHVARLQNIAPTRLETVYLSARVAYLDAEWAAAQEYLQSIISASPDHRSAQMLLGAVHLRSGNLAQAEMYLSTVVTAEPDNAEARKLLAETRLLMDKMDEAQAALQPMLAGSNTDVRSLSMAARATASLGQLDTAISYLEQSIEQSPGNVILQFQLVTTYLNAGRDDDARQLLDKMDVSGSAKNELQRESLMILTDIRSSDLDSALAKATAAAEKWPESAEAFQILGTVYGIRSEPDLARESFYQALELGENNINARRLIAVLETEQGNWQAAEQQYSAILELQPDAPWVLFALAKLEARRGEPKETIRWLERLRAVDSLSIAPRAILARFYLSDENNVNAEEIIEEALALNGNVAELHDIRGDVLLAQKKYAEAVRSYRRASEINRDNPEYRLNYAKSQQIAGDDLLATRTLEENIEQTMQHIPSAIQLVALKSEAGDLAGAMAVAERLVELHPGDSVPYALIAEVHMRNDNLLAASKAYDRALAIRVTRTHALRSAAIKRRLGTGNEAEPLERFLDERPLDHEVRAMLAEAYQRETNSRKAIEEYEKLALAQPDNAVVLNNLALAYFEANDDRATETATKAYEILPENGSVADTLGWILVNTGSIEEGTELLEKATQLSGGRAQIRYHLAVALTKSGDIDKAREVLEHLLFSDKDFESRAEAQLLLARLKEG
jgi:putative PEP-CTERM system TPR-repeat lipoprotein